MTDAGADETRGSPRPLRMLGVTVAWGACFIAIEWGLRDASVLWFASLRATLAGVALLTVALVQRRSQPRGVGDWMRISVLGLVNVAIAFAAMFAAVIGLSTGAAAVLANAQPLLILVPAWWLFGERPRRASVVGMVIGLAGLLVVAVPGGGGTGAWLSLTAAGAVTAGTLLARSLVTLDVVVVSAWHFLVGGVALAVWAAAVEGAPDITWTPRFVAVLLFLSLVGTAAAFVVWFEESHRSRLDLLTAWTFLVPVVGIGLSVVLLDERPSGWALSGLVMVLYALWSSVGRAALRTPLVVPVQSSARRAGGPLDTAGVEPGNARNLDLVDTEVPPVGGTVEVKGRAVRAPRTSCRQQAKGL